MPQKYFGRVILILAVLAFALLMILPPGSLFDRSIPWSKKLNLKPGIDMAGGTKLVYEIKAPEGQSGATGNLAEQVMNALKKRVDPDGVKNLIWRPQGGNRLEIQMPLTAQSAEGQAAREAFSAAQSELNKTNLRRSEVIRAVEKTKGDARRDLLTQLAMGSTEREKLFFGLASAHDKMKEADATGDPEQRAKAELTYENLRNQIEDTNLPTADLQVILEIKSPETRKAKLDELKAHNADFKARLDAIDKYVKAWDEFAKVKGSLDDAGELKRLLRGSGVLAFHIILDPSELSSPEARAMVERLKPGGKGLAPQAGDSMRWFEVDRPEEARHLQTIDYNDKHYVLAWTTPEKSVVNRPGQPKWALKGASEDRDQMGARVVAFEFDPQGAVYFGELTSNNKHKLLGAILDNKVISAATIQSTISSRGTISSGGGYTQADLDYLINTLNAGSLPAQLAEEPISEQTVGPQLGQDNLRRGLMSCVYGLVVIGIFLVGYYHLAGLVAFIAVLLDVVLILAFMAGVGATFTLPGVAGVVLTICIAVDANVLIFERLREEQVRGMGLRMALRNAYDRAFSAILDANVTTAITALVLYYIGSEEVKGFGLTLLLGMLSSMFTALYVTKTIFGILVDRFGVDKLGSLPLTLPSLNVILHPKIDWLKLFPAFLVFSVLSIGIGLWAFVVQMNQGRIFDIEFASGTSVQFELKPDSPLTIEQVREILDKKAKEKPDDLPAPSVMSLGTKNTEYEVVTPNANAKLVKDAVIAALGDKLNTQIESRFTNDSLKFEEARAAGVVVPITGSDVPVPGLAPVDSAGHDGGVAVILKDLHPMLSREQIKDRLERQRLQPQAGGRVLPFRDTDVVIAQANPESGTAVILISDSSLPYDKDQGKWADELATPTWRLVQDAVTSPAQLQKVTNFDAQVAGATQLKAIFALIVSTIVIMVYIWFRFGDMRFGTASAVATLHDFLFMIGAIGVSHYVAEWSVGQSLMIEPFRMNLTMVAAILTVLGYSMNDTVVVFDRIRENRGKFGVLTRQIVNDSINQTFSRTMLLSGTSLVLVGIMYVYGGSGIHGFTFALLIGIIEGTYSSIAIAAPLLLLGHGKGDQASKKQAASAARPQ